MIWYFIRAAIVVTLCGLAAGHCCADEIGPKKPPVIHLPTIPVIVEPDERDDSPVPPPPVNPITTVATLAEDTWYVIESDVPLIVLHSPAGLVGISEEVGPVKVRGKFADGTGKIETRVFKSQCLYFVNALKAGKTELIVVPVGVSAEADIIRQPLTVMGLAPIPPPDPKPDPIVPDPVAPAKLQIVILEDPALRAMLTSEQLAIADSEVFRSYCKSHCSQTNGTPDMRKLSIRADVTSADEWIKTAFAEPRSTVPFLVILTPTQTIAGPLPKTISETMTLLKKYGGE